jgi:hypothetical protein
MSTPSTTKPSDATATIGTLLPDSGQRDAIHVAVMAVVAGQKLRPCDDVGFLDDGAVGICEAPVGIVDPFLKTFVSKGERFWLAIYPRQITSLRHVWSHPGIVDETAVVRIRAIGDKAVSESWLRKFVSISNCPDYESVISAAIGEGDEQWDGQHLHFDGRDAHGEIPPEFWDHVEIVTGRAIPREKRATYFSCSC